MIIEEIKKTEQIISINDRFRLDRDILDCLKIKKRKDAFPAIYFYLFIYLNVSHPALTLSLILVGF